MNGFDSRTQASLTDFTHTELTDTRASGLAFTSSAHAYGLDAALIGQSRSSYWDSNPTSIATATNGSRTDTLVPLAAETDSFNLNQAAGLFPGLVQPDVTGLSADVAPPDVISSFSVYDASGDTTANTVFEGGVLRFNYSLTTNSAIASVGLQAVNSSGTVFNLGNWASGNISNALVNLANAPGLTGGTYQLQTVTALTTGAQVLSSAANPLQVESWGQTNGSFTDDTFNYSAALGTGAVFLGRGGTDTLNLGVSRAQITSINGLSFDSFNPLTNSTSYQATFRGTTFDFLTLADGREIYAQGIEHLRFADGSSLELQVHPNDAYYSQQWNLNVSDVADAWRFTQGASNVLLASLDTGVLSIGGVDMPLSRLLVNAATDDTGDSDHGHQAVSIMSSTGNNGLGIAGINWNSNVSVQDVYGGVTLQQAIQQVVSYARANSLRVVFQGGIQGESWLNDGGTQAQLESLIAVNSDIAVFAVAAGNGYRSIDDTRIYQQDIAYYQSIGRTDWPTQAVFGAGVARLQNTYSNVMAVGALEHTATTVNGLANASAVNRASYSNYGAGVIMAATDSYAMMQDGRTNSSFNGTSAANPNMAGIASLVWSANTNLTGSQVRQIIFDTAMDLGTSGADATFGRGLVNADAAVRRAAALGRNADVASLYSGNTILV